MGRAVCPFATLSLLWPTLPVIGPLAVGAVTNPDLSLCCTVPVPAGIPSERFSSCPRYLQSYMALPSGDISATDCCFLSAVSDASLASGGTPSSRNHQGEDLQKRTTFYSSIVSRQSARVRAGFCSASVARQCHENLGFYEPRCSFQNAPRPHVAELYASELLLSDCF